MAAELAPFSGFGPDALAFLAGLEADNSKTYFDDNRAIYDEQVRVPLQQLCLAVGDRLAAGPAPGIEYEPKVGRSMFRINRDLRFSKDKTPYHPHLDLAWWQGDHVKTSPGFIMRIRPDEVVTGVGVFALADERLTRFRQAVVRAPGEQLAAIVEATSKQAKTASLSEPSRKRVPKGFDPDHPRAHFLLFDGFHMSGATPTPKSITSTRFAAWVADRLAVYTDLHRWLVDELSAEPSASR